MGTEAQPAPLVPLLGASRSLTAEQVIERLRPWERAPVSGTGGDLRGESEGAVRVLLNMACTADGRATVGGRSGPIGDQGDRELFHALRTAVDAVLVGAGTVRAERYGRLVRDEAHRSLRRARGLAEEPLACIVSAGLTLSGEIPLLRDPAARIAVLTPSPTAELPESATPVEYVRAAREGLLDLPAALAELSTRLGVRTMLCEGGPHLNGQLFAAGLVDELFLSFAPKLAGGADVGTSLRIVSGPEFDPPLELELLDVLRSHSELLLRYRVGGSRDTG
jgi:riboflavin-specific deaminase-like protein